MTEALDKRVAGRLRLSGRYGNRRMKWIVVCMLAIPLLITACSHAEQPAMDGARMNGPEILSSATPELNGSNSPAATVDADELSIAISTTTPMTGLTGDCPSSAPYELGAAIARDYDFTSPEQVMTWFCDGAEFEDILVALETAKQTGASAEEMLIMLAAGLTWEEIWIEVGLSD